VTQQTMGAGERSQTDACGGRRVLACASSGGHFKQLVDLVARLPDVGSVTWVTYDRGLTHDLLCAAGHGHDRVLHVPYAAPRDVRNLLRDAVACKHLLDQEPFDLAVSTGAGLALATLPLARARGVRSVFIESATRADGPSLTGRLMTGIPGIERCTQNPGYPDGWREIGSVHDGFARGPDREMRGIRRAVVTLGTIAPFGFRRLLSRLLDVLPRDAEVLWQTGVTDVTGLPIDGRRSVPAREMASAMREADVVVAHAGTGTALTAFEMGVVPVLVPRRRVHGEHVDDHQVVTAAALAARGLALASEADELCPDHLVTAAAGSVVRRRRPPVLEL
jgi:UDP-N-acetylglucosamine--N-acetylmuramyl-(pentapeptide) pyrophosphoryl-undecaprenol N-acetylglucosamine transferase